MASRSKVLLIIFFCSIPSSTGEFGRATSYNPQYTPNMDTACGSILSNPKMRRSIMVSSSNSNFSPQNMKGLVFAAAAGEAIWLNGTSCGKIYNISCISVNTTTNPSISYPCTNGEVVQIMIVDRASNFVDEEYGLLLLERPFKAIANPFAQSMILEIVQVTP